MYSQMLVITYWELIYRQNRFLSPILSRENSPKNMIISEDRSQKYFLYRLSITRFCVKFFT